MQRLVGGNQLRADAALAGNPLRKAEVAGDRAAQLVGVDPAERERRLAEAQAVAALQREHPLDVAVVKLALLREQAAEPAVLLREDASRALDRQDEFLRLHRDATALTGPGRHSPSVASRGRSPASSRTAGERTRRSIISISITTPRPSRMPTASASARLTAIRGRNGADGTTAALSTATLVWLARLSTRLTTERCMAVS